MQTHRLDMRADPAFLSAIDEWRRRQIDIPTRAEAVRRLVNEGLAASRPVSIELPPIEPSAKPSDSVAQPRDIEPSISVSETHSLVSASVSILAEVAGKPWREQRGALRRAIVAHPDWAALRERDALRVSRLSSLDDFRPVCEALGIEVAALRL